MLEEAGWREKIRPQTKLCKARANSRRHSRTMREAVAGAVAGAPPRALPRWHACATTIRELVGFVSGESCTAAHAPASKTYQSQRHLSPTARAGLALLLGGSPLPQASAGKDPSGHPFKTGWVVNQWAEARQLSTRSPLVNGRHPRQHHKWGPAYQLPKCNHRLIGQRRGDAGITRTYPAKDGH